MHRRALLAAIERYKTTWLTDYPAQGWVQNLTQLSGASSNWRKPSDEENPIIDQFLSFIDQTPALFDNKTLPGHITGSAMVLSQDLQRVLLTLHAKLNKWLQLGGHSDGDALTHAVALREAYEESGLKKLDFLQYEQLFPSERALLGQRDNLPPLPFDFDVHLIPARPARYDGTQLIRAAEPEHYHFDVRYLIVVNGPDESIVCSDESQDLRWFTPAEAKKVTDERSTHRQLEKLEWLARELA